MARHACYIQYQAVSVPGALALLEDIDMLCPQGDTHLGLGLVVNTLSHDHGTSSGCHNHCVRVLLWRALILVRHLLYMWYAACALWNKLLAVPRVWAPTHLSSIVCMIDCQTLKNATLTPAYNWPGPDNRPQVRETGRKRQATLVPRPRPPVSSHRYMDMNMIVCFSMQASHVFPYMS
jgi:hypothetical protein